MDEVRRRRRMTFAWALFFVDPLLMAQAGYFGFVAGSEASFGRPYVYWRLMSLASWIGGIGGLISFLALSFKYGRPR